MKLQCLLFLLEGQEFKANEASVWLPDISFVRQITSVSTIIVALLLCSIFFFIVFFGGVLKVKLKQIIHNRVHD